MILDRCWVDRIGFGLGALHGSMRGTWISLIGLERSLQGKCWLLWKPHAMRFSCDPLAPLVPQYLGLQGRVEDRHQLHYSIVSYMILYYIISDHTISYYIILYYTILYYIILYCIILYYIILYYIILYYIILYYIILYYIILYCITLYDNILEYSILYYTILY